MFGRLLQHRGVHKLAWPRPHSPLASLIGQASNAVAAAEAEAAKAAISRRLPPVDEATSFESYLHAVGASEDARPFSSGEQAEQIRREAAEHRVRRRRGVSGLAGDFIEDESTLEQPPLPAGRVDPQEAAGRVVIDRSGQQPTSMWPPPSSSFSSSSSSMQQQQQHRRPSNDPPRRRDPPRRHGEGMEEEAWRRRPSNDPFSSAEDTRRTEHVESTRRPGEEAPPPDTRRNERTAVANMRQAIRDFRLTPRQVKAHLDRYVLADCMPIAC